MKTSRVNKGISFEKAIAYVQSLMDPKAVVTHNQKIIDRLGHLRQFDVVIRTVAAGHEILGVIECKDTRKRVDTPVVDAFLQKSSDVRANFTLLASKRGFTKQALSKARHYGIGTISLLKNDENDDGFSIGTQWYVEIFKWKGFRIRLHFLETDIPSLHLNLEPVSNWFKRELATTYLNYDKAGEFVLDVSLKKHQEIVVDGRPFTLTSISFLADREYEKRTKHIAFSGIAFYDWNKKAFLIPPGASVESDFIATDFSDWEKFDGEIPPPIGFHDWRLRVFMPHEIPNGPIVDVRKL